MEEQNNKYDNFIFNYQNTYFDVLGNREEIINYLDKLLCNENNNKYIIDIINYEKLIYIYSIYKNDEEILTKFNKIADIIKLNYTLKQQLIKRNTLKREE